MASVYKKGNGYVLQFKLRGKTMKLYGFSNKRSGQQFGEKLESLIAAAETGIEHPDTARWVRNLAESESPFYRKLVRLELVPERSTPGTVAEMIEIFEVSNADKKPRTVRNRGMVSGMIIGFFGDERKVAAIKPKDADRLWAHMIESYSPGSYMRNIKTVKQIFNVAVREKWIAENPFHHIRGGSVVNSNRLFYITQDMAAKVLTACPNARWRLIFSLGRYGGLRIPSELEHMKWSDIFWDQDKMRIWIPKKTGKNESLKCRYIPLFPELKIALEEYRETLPDYSPDLMFSGTNVEKNLRRGLTQIILKSGLTPWPKLFHNLRSTRESELLTQHPLHVVCTWIGNTPTIMLKHYAQVTDEDFRKAAGQDVPDSGVNSKIDRSLELVSAEMDRV